MARVPGVDSDPGGVSIELSSPSRNIQTPQLTVTRRRFEDAAIRLARPLNLDMLPRSIPSTGVQFRRYRQGIEAQRPGPSNDTTAWILAKLTVFCTTTAEMMRIVFLSNYANALLVCLPVAYVARGLDWLPEAHLAMNGAAMLPLILLIATATEEIGFHFGAATAAILSYSCGNIGTIVISAIMLRKNKVRALEQSLMGALIFNLLAVMGCHYVAGGVLQKEQKFNATLASINGSILLLSIANIVLPWILHSMARSAYDEEAALIVSRQLAICSILVYVAFVYFQSRSHRTLVAPAGDEQAEDETRRPAQLPLLAALLLLALSTGALTVATEFFLDALSNVVAKRHMGDDFITFILLPMVSNAVTHLTAVRDAWDRKLEKAAFAAIGSSIQIAMLIMPVAVIAGWIMESPMAISNDTFATVCAFLAILLLNSVTQNGKSNFMEGLLLLNAYFAIAAASFYLSRPYRVY